MNRKRNIDFNESQSLGRWWAWALMIILNLILVWGFVWQVIMGERFGNNPMSNIVLTATGCVLLVFSAIILSSKLKTYISNEGIYLRYFPFTIRTVFFAWSDVEKAYIRKYNAILEYGGFGIRRGIYAFRSMSIKNVNSDKAFIASGRYGLQLELKNGKRVLIGTQNPDKIKNIIGELGLLDL